MSDLTDSLALLVVDEQDAFLAPIDDRERILKRTSFAVAACKLLGIDVFFTEQVPDKLGGTNEALLALGGPEPTVFGKAEFSAFKCQPLIDALAAKGKKHLLIAGIEVPICVYQTVIDARDAGYQVTLLSDGIGGRRPEDFPPILETLQNAGCFRLPSESIFYSILTTATHPLFKAYTQLVKQYA